MLEYFEKYKPDWLYEALPFVYVGSGLLTILALRNGVALFAGGMLIVAALTTLAMRAKVRLGLTMDGSAKEAGQPGTLMQISLGRAHECGHPQIDAQHRGLCATANALLDHVVSGGSVRAAEPLLVDLLIDLERHFADEEAIFLAHDRTLGERHAEAHRLLLDKAKGLVESCRGGQASIKDLVEFVAYDLVTQHIAKEDKVFLARFGKLKS